MAFGEIDGVPPGTWFEDRTALRASGVHRHAQAGICGRRDEGAESIVLSGGYKDDDDFGDTLVYTGAGGRNATTGDQTHDQEMNGWNAALARSAHTGRPVRVIRGAHPDVYDPPQSGYRYDGLYRVADYWAKPGTDGFRVWRFQLERLPDQGAGWALPPSPRVAEPAPRQEVRVQRIVRSTAVAEAVKRLHHHRCQLCGEQVQTPVGLYAEAAHIRPLGHPHDGPDVPENVLCLCPTCHVRFDRYAVSVGEGDEVLGLRGTLRRHKNHAVADEYLAYHRDLFLAAQDARAA